MAARRTEVFELLFLLGVVALFYFVTIPAGITDPDGFVLDEGLPPSFSARLIAVLAALILLARLVRLGFFPTSALAPTKDDATVEPASEFSTLLTRRVWIGVVVSLVFAFVLVPVFGFAIASVLTIGVMLFVLGERSRLRLVLFPLLVTTGVWLLFGQLLSVKLPEGLLLPLITGT